MIKLWRIEERIGEGAFATVWRGSGPDGSAVAIKRFLSPLSADGVFNDLLQRGTRSSSSLAHPGIRTCLEAVVEDGITALIQEYLVGQDLTHRLRRGPMAVTEVVMTVERLLEALAHAHHEGIVHHGIRPSNVFFPSMGGLKVMDFGLLPMVEAIGLPTSKKIRIPIDYMAPERFDKVTGPSVDVYAIGLVTWEMLTGRRACPVSDRREQVRWHCKVGPSDVRSERFDCPNWLSAFIHRTTEINPVVRPADALATLTLFRETRSEASPKRHFDGGKYSPKRTKNAEPAPPPTLVELCQSWPPIRPAWESQPSPFLEPPPGSAANTETPLSGYLPLWEAGEQPRQRHPRVPVDLRTDGCTRPSQGMRDAMARAVVGDDALGEDPTVNHLQQRVAEILGKEAAVLLPSGTMANQVAFLLHCSVIEAGVIVGEDAHMGNILPIAGVRCHQIGRGGTFTAAELTHALDSAENRSVQLIGVENTHNSGGGAIWPPDELVRIGRVARDRNLAIHMDGARLFNAAVASGVSVRELAAPFDTVSVCLSKGLGAPAGSVFAGSRASIDLAWKIRKFIGGTMRQAGILAAAGIWALDHNMDRLAEDHANSRYLAEGLAALPNVRLDPSSVRSNIVFVDLLDPLPPAQDMAERLANAGVLCFVTGPRRLRFVTHLDAGRPECEFALGILISAFSSER